MYHSKVYYTIQKVRVNGNSQVRIELHCSRNRQDVENLEAMSKSIPADMPGAAVLVSAWREHLKNTLGDLAIEI